jgi:hypothetical protein
VDPAYDIEIWGFAVIHDQKQMHMIRHDDEIGGRHGRVSRMGCAPRFGNRLTRLRQRDRGIVVDAREYLPPPFRTEGEKEEFQASPMEIQFHESIIANSVARRRGSAPNPVEEGEIFYESRFLSATA